MPFSQNHLNPLHLYRFLYASNLLIKIFFIPISVDILYLILGASKFQHIGDTHCLC